MMPRSQKYFRVKTDAVYLLPRPFFNILLSLFWKNESRLMRSPCCLCVCVSPLSTLNGWINLYETRYIRISWHLSPSQWRTSQIPLISLCVCMSISPLIVARQRLGKYVPAATNTRNNRRIVGRVVLYALRVILKESLCVEGAPDIGKTLSVKPKLMSGHETQMGLESRTYWQNDRRS
jgi:hypothetical protein